jgi:hypothetical protein
VYSVSSLVDCRPCSLVKIWLQNILSKPCVVE